MARLLFTCCEENSARRTREDYHPKFILRLYRVECLEMLSMTNPDLLVANLADEALCLAHRQPSDAVAPKQTAYRARWAACALL